MLIPGQNADADNALSNAERRRSGRLLCKGLESNLGEVLDISGTGLRLRSSTALNLKPGEVGLLNIQCASLCMQIAVVLAWTKRAGFRRYEHGLRFLELAPEARRALWTVAREGVYAEVVYMKV